ncbi:SLBB domain-containing protein [Oscillatoria sp. FACHB-1406]|uniref:SLBB domain-containing protein n=1 Tax=Oscillatoria sp. FACHB-1406 TaxID=2692846 RepID=UPI0016854916|nr:SLBB domain-containing protein [Oscillatoria sp. FACHB-1406]MBD2577608.1 SLBB domain-containing protein [Oscillatoria sp. FACHB-1406]
MNQQTLKVTCPIALLLWGTMSLPAPSMAQQQPSVPLAQRSLSSIESSYFLGGGDRISIDVFEVPQYSGSYQLPIDGIISLPLVGAVPIGGLTLEQAASVISNRYAAYLKRPIITIRLLSTRPINVFVSGEVSKPGSFSIPLIGGSGDQPGIQYPTLTQALKTAGGVTLAADISQVQVRRRTSGGGEQAYTVNFKDFIETGNPQSSLTLRDGDAIYVPAATEVSLRELRQLANVEFAADINAARTVSVIGQVVRPGSYYIQTAQAGIPSSLPTLTRAIKEAGGITQLADVRNVQLRRLTKSGTEQLIAVNLWQLLQSGDISQDTVIQDGDTIIVPQASEISAAEAAEIAKAQFSPDTIKVAVSGEVRQPGIVNIPPNTPLNQAIMTAGGFNRSRADNDRVTLIRLNPDGSVVSREVPIDISQGISEQSNPLLRDNDIIVVGRNRATAIADSLDDFLRAGANALSWFSIPSRIFGILDVLGITNTDSTDSSN